MSECDREAPAHWGLLRREGKKILKHPQCQGTRNTCRSSAYSAVNFTSPPPLHLVFPPDHNHFNAIISASVPKARSSRCTLSEHNRGRTPHDRDGQTTVKYASTQHTAVLDIISEIYNDRGMESITRLHLVSRLRMGGSIPLLPLHAFMAWTATTSLLSSPNYLRDDIKDT